MPTLPYQYKNIELGRILNPLILVSIKAAWGWQDLWVLVDSGADTTMLSASLAMQLGITFDRHRKTKLWGIGKQAVWGSPGGIELKFDSTKISVRSYFVDTDDTVILLGRLDIFDQFSITFDTGKQAVVFHDR